MTTCKRDDEPEPAYTHFDITGEEHAEQVTELVHKFAGSVGLQLPDGLPHTYTELENWKRRVPPYKRGSNGFKWETQNGKVCYLMALVEPAGMTCWL